MTTTTTTTAKASTGVTLSVPLMTALDKVWSRIRLLHPEVPEIVLTLGSGSGKGSLLKYGHFANARWQHGDDKRLPEVFISGEGLRRDATAVLGTLLHEATHGLASVRGVKDTSRQGRYHNTRFKTLGEELGLTVSEVPVIGWSQTKPTEPTLARYRRQLTRLAGALVWLAPPRNRRPDTSQVQQRHHRPLRLRPPHPTRPNDLRRRTHHLPRL